MLTATCNNECMSACIWEILPIFKDHTTRSNLLLMPEIEIQYSDIILEYMSVDSGNVLDDQLLGNQTMGSIASITFSVFTLPLPLHAIRVPVLYLSKNTDVYM